MVNPVLLACLLVVIVFVYFYIRAMRRRSESELAWDEETTGRTEASTADAAAAELPAAEAINSRRRSKNSRPSAEHPPPPSADANRSSIGRRILGRQGPAYLSFLKYLGRRKKRMYSTGRMRPPSDFFEPVAFPAIPKNMSADVFYLLHHLQVLEPPSEWILSPADIERVVLEPGEYLFRPGDCDNSVYVVLEGSLSVIITDECKKEFDVKRITEGSCLLSLLSVLDMIFGAEGIYRTVSGKAIDKCTVARYNVRPICEAFKADPGAWVRSIQIIITRLQHVTMTTLHQYLGLSFELTKPTLLNLSHPVAAQQQGDRTRHLSGKETTPRRRRLSSAEEAATDAGKLARKWFAEAIGLKEPADLALLEDRIKIEYYPENHVIVEQGSKENDSLLLVLSGSLMLAQRAVFDDDAGAESAEVVDAIVFGKELVGALHVLSGEPSFYKIKSRSACRLAIMSKQHFYEIMALKPEVIVSVAHSVLKRLSPFLRGIDFALDWEMVDNGQAVYRQGDTADCLHVVLSGRLRSVVKQETKSTKDAVEEFGKGDLVGMVEVVMKKPRATTVLAVRYSTLAKVPDGLLNYVKLKYPQVGFRMMRLLSHYYSNHHRKLAAPVLDPVGNDLMSHVRNLHTIAILPADKTVPLVAFTCEFYHALQENLSTLRLSSKIVADNLSKEVLEKTSDFRLMHWLNAQEDSYPMVLYECDFDFTTWTRRCIRQADAILVVANGESDPANMSAVVDTCVSEGIRTNKELVLLWPADTTRRPRGTNDWLKARTWFSGHHHIRAPRHMYQWTHTEDEDRVVSYYEDHLYSRPVDLHSDFSRVSRLLTGNAVGLVLGGGGARGGAHVGVVKTMVEQSIPIDIVAGCSIGALIGGLYCDNPDVNTLEERARPWFMNALSVWQQIFDLTYWYCALFTGAGFNRTIKMLFGDREIEDLWIPYLCVTTDLTTSEIRVHRNGPLWAYCRASMSLAGYLPPLCDPQDGHLLLDGGYVNNVPADIVYAMGIRTVFAVDVGSSDSSNLTNYGDTLSGTWVLWHKLNPWSQPVRVLSMQEVQQRLAYVSCIKNLDHIKKAHYCYYLRPPINSYKTLDFTKFDEIAAIGYKYGNETLKKMIEKDNKLQCLVQPELRKALVKLNTLMPPKFSQLDRSVASSLTDLAAAVSYRIRPEPHAEIDAMDEYDELPDVVWEGLEETDSETPTTAADELSEAKGRRPPSATPPTFNFYDDNASDTSDTTEKSPRNSD